MRKPLVELQQDEQVIKNEIATRIKSKFHVQFGRVYLTDKRIVFYKSANWMFGLLGMIMPAFRGGVQFDLSYDKIKSAEQGKFGLNKKVLKLNLRDGRTLQLGVSSDLNSWIGEIKQRCQ